MRGARGGDESVFRRIKLIASYSFPKASVKTEIEWIEQDVSFRICRSLILIKKENKTIHTRTTKVNTIPYHDNGNSV